MNTLVNNNKPGYLSWFSLAILILFQYYLFLSYIHHAVNGFYPINYDQSSYLSYSYHLFEQVKTHSLSEILQNVSKELSTGILFPLNALLYFSVLGASRLSALLPNFIYFVLLQTLIFFTVKKISGKSYLGFLFIGMILALNTPFITGGIADFRMDFIAFSFYGIFVSAIIQSNIFLNRSWTIVALATAVLLILLRFITAVYFLMDIGVIATYFAFLYFLGGHKNQDTKIRLINVALFGSALTVLTLLYTYLHRAELYKYYIVGHITGAESHFRGMPAGSNLLSFILFYPESIISAHLGMAACHVIIISSICSLLLYLCYRKQFSQSVSKVFSWKNGAIFLSVVTLMPLIPLTLDPARSVVVGGIVVIPLLWLLLWPLLYINKNCKSNFFLTSVTLILSVFSLYAGLHYQIHSFSTWKLNPEKQKDLSAITQMYLDIGNYATQKHWDMLMLSCDQAVDYMTYTNEQILYYEKYGKLLTAGAPPLGNSILSITKNEAIDSLKNSNVAILTINSPVMDSSFPFNKSAAKLSPILIKYANAHFNTLKEYSFMGYKYRVYVKK